MYWKKRKTIIMHVGYGFTEQEIAMKLGMKNLLFIQERPGILKMNPNYKPMKQKSFFLGKRMAKRNHQLGLVI